MTSQFTYKTQVVTYISVGFKHSIGITQVDFTYTNAGSYYVHYLGCFEHTFRNDTYTLVGSTFRTVDNAYIYRKHDVHICAWAMKNKRDV